MCVLLTIQMSQGAIQQLIPGIEFLEMLQYNTTLEDFQKIWKDDPYEAKRLFERYMKAENAIYFFNSCDRRNRQKLMLYHLEKTKK